MKIYGRNRAEQLFNLKLSQLNLLLYFYPSFFDSPLHVNQPFEFARLRKITKYLGALSWRLSIT